MPTFDLTLHGIDNPGACHWNTRTTQLVEMALARGEGKLARTGALAIRRPVKGHPFVHRMVVSDPENQANVAWSKDLCPLSPALFSILYGRLLAYLQGRELFVQNGNLGGHENRRTYLRVVTEKANVALMARNLLRGSADTEESPFFPDFTILFFPDFIPSPVVDQVPGKALAVVDLSKRLGLILGTSSTDELPRMIFSLLSYFLPEQAGRGAITGTLVQDSFGEDVHLFLGDEDSCRQALAIAMCDGDNILEMVADGPLSINEGGLDILTGGGLCALSIVEPYIQPAFGSLLECGGLDEDSRALFVNDCARLSWPIGGFPTSRPRTVTPSPLNAILAIRDETGALPPIASVDPDMFCKLFAKGPSVIANLASEPAPVSNAKPAETDGNAKADDGKGKVEDEDTDIRYGGALDPAVSISFNPFYAGGIPLRRMDLLEPLLRNRIVRTGVNCWLVNTGRIFREDGTSSYQRPEIAGRVVRAALSGGLSASPTRRDLVFGYQIPTFCKGLGSREVDPLGQLEGPALTRWHVMARAVHRAIFGR